MGLFTIHFELGERTLETLTRIASTSVIRIELGPETRAMIERFAPADEEGESTVGRVVKKSAECAPFMTRAPEPAGLEQLSARVAPA
jgi:hypothetical protein